MKKKGEDFYKNWVLEHLPKCSYAKIQLKYTKLTLFLGNLPLECYELSKYWNYYEHFSTFPLNSPPSLSSL